MMKISGKKVVGSILCLLILVIASCGCGNKNSGGKQAFGAKNREIKFMDSFNEEQRIWYRVLSMDDVLSKRSQIYVVYISKKGKMVERFYLQGKIEMSELDGMEDEEILALVEKTAANVETNTEEKFDIQDITGRLLTDETGNSINGEDLYFGKIDEVLGRGIMEPATILSKEYIGQEISLEGSGDSYFVTLNNYGEGCNLCYDSKDDENIEVY